MSEEMIQAIGVTLFVLILIFGIVKMKSPSKGLDALGGAISEIQKVMEPQAKRVIEAKKKEKSENKSENGEDKEGAV